MKKKVNVVLGKNDLETAKIIANLEQNAFDNYLIYLESDDISFVSKSKNLKKSFECYNYNVMILTLLTEFRDCEIVNVFSSDKLINDEIEKNMKFIGKNYHFINDSLELKNSIDSRTNFYMKISKIAKKLKLNRVYKICRKIYHIDIPENIVVLDSKIVSEIECSYKFIELNYDNLNIITNSSDELKEFKKLFECQNTKGLALFDGDICIGKAFIKGKNSYDRVFKIKSDNSYVITSMHIADNYRGKNLQQALIYKLIEKYVHDKNDFKVYAYIYNYNIPSLKNFLKSGFVIKKEKRIIRFLKRSLNKDVI